MPTPTRDTLLLQDPTPAPSDRDAPDHRALADKLTDLGVPGAVIEVDPDEADALGAFPEDALTEEEARASSADLEP